MAAFIFRAQPALDQDGNLVKVGFGSVYAIGDTAYVNPLTVTKPGDVTGTQINVSQIGLTESFTIEGHAEVWWKSGAIVVHLASFSGALEAIEASRLAAESAAAAANAAPGILPAGGTAGQVLAKASNADRDVQWVDQAEGGGSTTGGSVQWVRWTSGTAPTRPTADPAVLVMWIGPLPEPPLVATGTAGRHEHDIFMQLVSG